MVSSALRHPSSILVLVLVLGAVVSTGALLVLHPRLVLGVDLVLVVVLAISHLRTLGEKVPTLPASKAHN